MYRYYSKELSLVNKSNGKYDAYEQMFNINFLAEWKTNYDFHLEKEKEKVNSEIFLAVND